MRRETKSPPSNTRRHKVKLGLLWGLAAAAIWTVVMEVFLPSDAVGLLVHGTTALLVFPTAGLIWGVWSTRSRTTRER